MKSIATLAVAAGCLVSAGALYESHETQQAACLSMQKAANRAAQAPLMPAATGNLGFTPMSQFEKVYPPVCQPPDTNADLWSSLTGGILVALGCYVIMTIISRFHPKQH